MEDINISLEIPFNAEPDAHGMQNELGGSGLAFSNVGGAAAILRSSAQDRSGLLPARRTINEAVLEQVVERANFLPACFLAVGVERASATCKILASGTDFKGQNGSWSGTGFLVGDSILLTNNHVLNSPAVAARSSGLFNFQVDEAGKPLETQRFQINPAKLFITSPVDELDYTFVFVEGEPGKKFGKVPLRRSSVTISVKEPANIIQHPAGRPKEVVLQEGVVEGMSTVFMHYRTDTEPGSSGACVFTNEWRSAALHHASRGMLNEGIKFSAIAAHLETQLSTPGNAAAIREVLGLFRDADPMTGFFGALGRTATGTRAGLEQVVDAFKGESSDVDVAFWNVEWLANRTEKIDAVAEVIARMNLDIWALSESSPDSAERLVERLRSRFELPFEVAHSEPSASSGRQTTSVLWNSNLVEGKRENWPSEIDGWFRVHSSRFGDLNLEAEHGKVFDRYPGLFRFKAKNRGADQGTFDFLLVPLHLKAMSEGRMRRRMASQILAAAIRSMQRDHGEQEVDWVIGGDFNAELASRDFAALQDGGMTALTAADEAAGAMTYLKSPRSLIDHVFLSANLNRVADEQDLFIVAAEKTIPDFVSRISDHRPVLVRLSLLDRRPEAVDEAADLPASLRRALEDLRASQPPRSSRSVAEAVQTRFGALIGSTATEFEVRGLNGDPDMVCGLFDHVHRFIPICPASSTGKVCRGLQIMSFQMGG